MSRRRVPDAAVARAATLRAAGVRRGDAAKASGVSVSTMKRRASAGAVKGQPTTTEALADLRQCRATLLALVAKDDVSPRDRVAALAELRKLTAALVAAEALTGPSPAAQAKADQEAAALRDRLLREYAPTPGASTTTDEPEADDPGKPQEATG